MKKLILIACLLIYSNGWAYNETNLLKLKAINVCQGCDLSGINLRDTNLSGANLSDADLSGAYLRDTNLSGANLSDADLSGANLADTDLSGADLTNAHLSGANLRGAKYCKTKMPSGELNDDCEE